MKPNRWLRVLVVAIPVAGIVAFLLDIFCPNPKLSWLRVVADLSLVASLAALLLYVYYTYVLARESAVISASIVLKQSDQIRTDIRCIVQNFSKFPLHCWCDLNGTVFETPVALDGFYAAKTSFDVQPFGTVEGHFTVEEVLGKAGITLADARQQVDNQAGRKDAIYLNVDFWYRIPGTPAADSVRNPRQPYYFDVARNLLVLDF
jgi:hypothetical protein